MKNIKIKNEKLRSNYEILRKIYIRPNSPLW